MTEHPRPFDMSFIARETAHTPMHVGTLEIFDVPDEGFDYSRLADLIADRLAFVPRYRQRLRRIPGGMSNPVWIDDEDFDLTYHVRRSALPKPGSMSQLRELVARIMSRPLDRDRPLWETYLVEGVETNRFAVFAKSHLALVDGTTVDLAQLVLDDNPEPEVTPEDSWRPARNPSSLGLLGHAALEVVGNPRIIAENIRGRAVEARHALGVARKALDVVSPRPSSTPPLRADLCEQRRLVTVETELSTYRTIRREQTSTVNDVVLATLTGALRAWLMSRGEPLSSGTRLRAVIPLSVTDDEFAEPTSLGSQVTPHLLSLPVGEANPIMRLHQVSFALKAHKETGRAVAAERLAGIAGFAPTTLHALGARVAGGYQPRSYDLLITNVPGPQFPLYAAGAPMRASYPVLPLEQGHPLAIGATSYDGRVFYGVDADRDAIPDVEVIGQCISEALQELVDASAATRTRAPRGRKPPAKRTKGRGSQRSC